MKQAFRIISRMKGYTALSLLGLIISLSGTVIISRYIYQEWTVDHFMPALDRTYVCCRQYAGEGEWWSVMTFDPNHEECFVSPVKNQSDVECWTDVHIRSMLTVKTDEGNVFFPKAVSVDSTFTQVYPLEAKEGTLVLRANGQCILSEELARRVFPGESAIGKTLTVGDRDVNTVVGIFRQPATKTSVRFDFADYADQDFYAPQNSYALGLIRLREGADMQAYNERQPEQTLAMFSRKSVRYGIQPYTKTIQKERELYWSSYECLIPIASAAHLWMLLFVAVLLLFVGLFNFVNLFAVMRSHRRHELEVRRLFGASRLDIFCQLYAETFLLALLTMIGVWTVVELTEPLLATYYNIEVLPQWRFDVGLTLIVIFALPLIVALRELLPIRGGREGTVGREGWGGKSLLPLGGGREGAFLFLQFFISLALLNVSIYFMRQLHVMMTADPGFRTKGLLSATIYPPNTRGSWTEEEWKADKEKKKGQTEIVRQRLKACPYLKDITIDSHFIGNSLKVELADGSTIDIMDIGCKESQLYGLQLIEGVMPDSSITMDDYACVANESAMKALGIKDRKTDFVQFADRLWWSSDKDCTGNPPYRIMGVVKDFNPGRQSEPIRPMLLMYGEWSKDYDILDADQMNGRSYLLDVAEGHEEDIIRDLRALEKEINGTEELSYQWVEDRRRALYEEDRRTSRIFVTFSLLAIAVTCLGVLGLMMFDVRRRYREIALRKVNGATFRDIALLLSRRYLIIFGVAAIASLPVSLLVIHQLMASYTIRTSFAWWIPLVSIILILLLCALTLWQQVWRATRIKPYKVLKEN